jgi:hypothetical protein
MKNITLTFAIMLFAGSLSAQSVQNKVTSNAGGSYEKPTAQLEFTVGEPFVSILTRNGYSISQGFHQPAITIVPVRLSEDGELVEVGEGYNAETITAGKRSSSSASLDIYPNPTSDFVNIRINGTHPGKGRVLLYNTGGQLVHDTRFVGGFVSIEFSAEPAGNYILHLIDDIGKLSGSYKIVKSN